MKEKSEIPFSEVVAALIDTNMQLTQRLLFRLSDLERKEAKLLEQAWSKIPAKRRRLLMENVQDMGESDALLDFQEVASLAVKDSDPEVRLPAVQTMWEFEDPMLIPVFTELMENDPDEAVRAAAASGLGKYIYLGEIEELPPSSLHQLEERLLSVVHGRDGTEVRRHALEALGYSSRPEVQEMLGSAYATGEQEWVISALFAMGRSGDQRWQPQVMESLENQLSSVRFEAARAAGEIELTDALPTLKEMLGDTDQQVREACIWSLSQIGGEGVRATLDKLLAECEDEEEQELIEEALENLGFTEELNAMAIDDLFEEDEEGDLADEDADDLDLEGWEEDEDDR